MILSLPAYNPSPSHMAFHYTQNRKQMPLSEVKHSMWSGPIDVAVTWSYTIFTFFEALTFINTSPDGAFVSTWSLLLSGHCHGCLFLAAPLGSPLPSELLLSAHLALLLFIACTTTFILHGYSFSCLSAFQSECKSLKGRDGAYVVYCISLSPITQ